MKILLIRLTRPVIICFTDTPKLTFPRVKINVIDEFAKLIFQNLNLSCYGAAGI